MPFAGVILQARRVGLPCVDCPKPSKFLWRSYCGHCGTPEKSSLNAGGKKRKSGASFTRGRKCSGVLPSDHTRSCKRRTLAQHESQCVGLRAHRDDGSESMSIVPALLSL